MCICCVIPDTEVPFYMGKGTGDRINSHERYMDTDSNEAKKRIIHKLHAEDKQVLKKKVAEFTSELGAFIYEWCLINLIYNHGELVNVRHGGQRKQADRRVVDVEGETYILPNTAAAYRGQHIET